jgi:hypothetical protein
MVPAQTPLASVEVQSLLMEFGSCQEYCQCHERLTLMSIHQRPKPRSLHAHMQTPRHPHWSNFITRQVPS